MHKGILNKKSLNLFRPVSARKARGPGFPGPAPPGPARGPGLVLPSLVGTVVIDDQIHLWEVESSAYQISADEQPDLRPLELADGHITLEHT